MQTAPAATRQLIQAAYALAMSKAVVFGVGVVVGVILVPVLILMAIF